MYRDKSLTYEERAAALVSELTLDEKICQLSNLGAPIPRLNIPFYNYWSEASHGFFGPFKYRPMDVTSFPVCLAMSQTWDCDQIKAVASAISDECRAYANTDGDELHMWCPTINLARDPRNGRSDENFGEDPYLTGRLAAAYIKGMQGDHPTNRKTIATPKHYALNSSENNRHRGSSNVDEATLREYYTAPFAEAVKEGGAESIMTSYNRINGVPASANEKLLQSLLREEWGFDGFVVSDCGAVADVYKNHTQESIADISGFDRNPGHLYAKSMAEASAMTLQAGTDMSCGTEHKYNLLQALEQGLIEEAVLDRSLIRIFTSRFRLGLFDPKEQDPYGQIGKDVICSPAHRKLAEEVGADSIVLLKNDKALLPLDKEKMGRVLVVGPNAIYRELGGYSAGSISKVVETKTNVMALEGIKGALAGTGAQVMYEKGWCSGRERVADGMNLLPGAELPSGDSGMDAMMQGIADVLGPNVGLQDIGVAFMSPERHKPEDADYQADNDVLFQRALEQAKTADYVIVIAGTDATTASEEHDRETLALPYGQDEKIGQLLAANPNTIVVISALGAVTGAFFQQAHTVLNAHFAGESQGSAIAKMLFGDVTPSARLTATWYQSVDDLPHINDYGLKRNDTLDGKTRTYWYFEGKPLFPFGHGLSYTQFQYDDFTLSQQELDANDTLKVSVNVTNIGGRAGSEVVQLYAAKCLNRDNIDCKPFRQLKGFQKIKLEPGEQKRVELELPLSQLTFWSNFHQKMVVESGTYAIELGRNAADMICSAEIKVTGRWKPQLSAVSMQAERQVLTVGEGTKVSVTAVLEDTSRISGGTVCWSSSNDAVLTVDDRGVVNAVGTGAASVQVSVTEGGRTLVRRLPFAVRPR